MLAALGLASVTAVNAATYNGDLLVGFTTGTGSDAIYDLGAATSLTNGQTWDLTSLLTGYTLTDVQWGVIGSTGPVTGGNGLNNQRYVYTTDLTTPQNLTGKTLWTAVNGTAVPGIYQNFTTAGAGSSLSISATDANSWYGSTTASGGIGNPSGFFTVYADPNTTGLTTVDFYQSVALDTAATQFGTFTLDGTSTLTFNLTPVPEPSTCALLAVGGGFFVMTWRNKFRSKKS